LVGWLDRRSAGYLDGNTVRRDRWRVDPSGRVRPGGARVLLGSTERRSRLPPSPRRRQLSWGSRRRARPMPVSTMISRSGLLTFVREVWGDLRVRGCRTSRRACGRGHRACHAGAPRRRDPIRLGL